MTVIEKLTINVSRLIRYSHSQIISIPLNFFQFDIITTEFFEIAFEYLNKLQQYSTKIKLNTSTRDVAGKHLLKDKNFLIMIVGIFSFEFVYTLEGCIAPTYQTLNFLSIFILTERL